MTVLEEESGCINWNSNGKWTSQNFIAKFIIILVEIIRYLIMITGILLLDVKGYEYVKSFHFCDYIKYRLY